MTIARGPTGTRPRAARSIMALVQDAERLTASPVNWVRADARRLDVALGLATVGVSWFLIAGGGEPTHLGWPEVAAGVGAFALVVLRRTRPSVLLVVAVSWAAAHSSILSRPSSMSLASLVLLTTAASHLERGTAVVLGSAVGMVLYANALSVNDALGPLDARALIVLVAAGAAVGIADAMRSWRRYQTAAEAEIRSTVLAAESQARERITEERLALARELHDLLAHSLSVMNVQTGAALHLLDHDVDAARESLSTARDAGRTVLDELRELLTLLRAADDQPPLTALPGVADLPALMGTMRAAGMDLTTVVDGEPRDLAPAVSLAAYRICQEALTNAAKHGDGTGAVRMCWTAGDLTMTISNPLPGTPQGAVQTTGHGLVGMRERAAVNGGTLEVDRTAAAFTVHAVLPVPSHEAGPA